MVEVFNTVFWGGLAVCFSVIATVQVHRGLPWLEWVNATMLALLLMKL